MMRLTYLKKCWKVKNISFIIMLIFLVSCGEEPEQEKKVDWDQNKSSDMHRVFAEEEHKKIEGFLSRRPDWNMTTSESGLRYMIYHKEDSSFYAKAGMYAHVSFEIKLLDGTVCYSTDEGETESFLIEKDDVESGIHEGIKYMKEGEKAKFILPSHLAHGLIGDRNKIPMLSTLIYDIHLHKLSY